MKRLEDCSSCHADYLCQGQEVRFSIGLTQAQANDGNVICVALTLGKGVFECALLLFSNLNEQI